MGKSKTFQQVSAAYTFSERQYRKSSSYAEEVAAGVNGPTMLRVLYDEAWEQYYGKPRVTGRGMDNASERSLWERIGNRVAESRVPPQDFIASQFSYFHRNFGTAPKPHQLGTKAAVTRATEGGVPVVPHALRPQQVDLMQRHKYAEIFVQKTMQAQELTREQFYERLVLTEQVALPPEFLADDPVYQEVKRRVRGKR